MRIRSLAVVGGASAYMPGLMAALLHRLDRLALREVRLHDIDRMRLGIVERLCRRMAEAAESGLRVRATTDPVEAVAGIDAVLNSARPGGFRCRRIDETLPIEFGLPGQETVGPGGFFFALRSVPRAIELARTMEAHAPNSILLNYTNPTNIVTQALLERFRVPVIGLCDQSVDDLATLARAAGAGPPERFRCAGLNHATWYADIVLDGRPFRALDGAAGVPEGLDEEHRLRFAICRRLAEGRPGHWPNSYLAYYEDPEAFVSLARRSGPRTDAIVERLDGYYRHFAQEAERPRPDLRHHRGAKDFGDMAVDVLEALGSDRRRRVPLNVPNRGMIPALDPDTVVEVVMEVDATGVHQPESADLPVDRTGLCRSLERYQRATASLAAGRGDAVEALAANPLVGDAEIARRLIARAPALYGEDLPAVRTGAS